jgi:DNA-directed RNA polymerase subunit RPC12/RpoP
MPFDRSYEDDDDKKSEGEGSGRRFQDFDCPDCSANNPWDDGIGDGDEIRCYYCGQEYLAQVTDEGRLKLKAM